LDEFPALFGYWKQNPTGFWGASAKKRINYPYLSDYRLCNISSAVLSALEITTEK
jgi:hypothetical protein